MKNMILILSMFFLFSGCDKEKQTEPQENSIYGTWQLSKQSLGNVGDTSVNWTEVSNGYTVIFGKNNIYSSTKSPTCPSNPLNNGTYNLYIINSKSFVTISLECVENNSGVFDIEYSYSFDDNQLILSPTFSCDEGCAYGFHKIE